MIVELLFDVCVTITLICNNHFDFDSVDLKGMLKSLSLILNTRPLVSNGKDSLHLIANIPFRMTAVIQDDLIYDRKSK